jgi:hypothetical protein
MERERKTRIEMTDEEWIAARTLKTLPKTIPEPDVIKPNNDDVNFSNIKEENEPKPDKKAKKKPAKIHRKPK